jgi:subtilase family serine protease
MLGSGLPNCSSTDGPTRASPDSSQNPTQNPASPEHTFVGHVLPITAKLTPVGRLPADRRLHLTLAVPLRDSEGLDRLLKDLYDPSSASYRQFLTSQQFVERFAPLESDYAAVVAYAKDNGLEVKRTHPDRTLVSVEASVGDIERAFHTVLSEYQLPGTSVTFHAPQVEPSLDRDVPIVQIVGLDNFADARRSARRAQFAQSTLSPAMASPVSASGSGGGGAYRSKDLRAAYAPGVSLTGQGQSVGIYSNVEYLDLNDVTGYQDLNALPHTPVVKVFADGGSDVPPNTDGGEVTLDVDMVLAMAPGATVIVYQDHNWLEAVTRAASDKVVHQMSSSSWSWDVGTAYDDAYKRMGSQGQTLFIASDDGGAYYGQAASVIG